MIRKDEHWMSHALALALRAEREGEVPIGAVLVRDNELLAEGWNKPISSHDPSAHAEIVAIRHAAEAVKNYRLPGTTLYVTLEPCAMCAGALIQARIERLVFGAYDPRAGAIESVFEVVTNSQLNHRVKYSGGVLQQECANLLQSFFKKRR